MSKTTPELQIVTGISKKTQKEWKGLKIIIGEVEVLTFPRPWDLKKIEEALEDK